MFALPQMLKEENSAPARNPSTRSNSWSNEFTPVAEEMARHVLTKSSQFNFLPPQANDKDSMAPGLEPFGKFAKSKPEAPNSGSMPESENPEGEETGKEMGGTVFNFGEQLFDPATGQFLDEDINSMDISETDSEPDAEADSVDETDSMEMMEDADPRPGPGQRRPRPNRPRPRKYNSTGRHRKRRKLKLIYKIARIWPGYWGPKGIARMQCDFIGKDIFVKPKPCKPIDHVIVDYQFRNINRRIRLANALNRRVDRTVKTVPGARLTYSFNDLSIRDRLIIERPGGGRDRQNLNQANDYFQSDVTTPNGGGPGVQAGTIIPDTQNVRIRVDPRIIPSQARNSFYNLNVRWQRNLYRKRTRHLLFGFIPWKVVKESWKPRTLPQNSPAFRRREGWDCLD